MNPQALQMSRELYLRAVEDGPVEAPEAILQMLSSLPSHAAQPFPLNTITLEKQVAEKYSVWNTFSAEKALETEQTERCVAALRWVLQELRIWTPELAQSSLRLQVLLAALSAFDVANAGIDAVLQQVITPLLPEGLHQLLDNIGTQSAQSPAENSLLEEVQTAGKCGDYEQLELLTRRLNLRLPPDVRLAIYLLWRVQPNLLTGVINRKQDALISFAVCNVLAASAPEFALSVDDVTFKFFSVCSMTYLRPEHALDGIVDLIGELLIQVAKSHHWFTWLQAYYKSPRGNNVSENALSIALGQLEAQHWKDFINAIQLSTYAHRSAEPVANILIRFYQTVGAPRANEMWSLAFQRWDQWDYGREDRETYMSAAIACPLDFPVAMYYAHRPLEEVKTEEARLVEAIASVEQAWFSSESNLVTHRNRLLSRLRLVRHGKALASGVTEALPPPAQPGGDYAALRYRYFDVNSPRKSA